MYTSFENQFSHQNRIHLKIRNTVKLVSRRHKVKVKFFWVSDQKTLLIYVIPGRPATKSIALKLLLWAWTMRWTRCLVLGDSIPGPNKARRGWKDPSWKLSRNLPFLLSWLFRCVWINWNHFSHSLFPSLSLRTVLTALWNSLECSKNNSLLPWRVGSCIMAEGEASLSSLSLYSLSWIPFLELHSSYKSLMCKWRRTRRLHKLSSCWVITIKYNILVEST